MGAEFEYAINLLVSSPVSSSSSSSSRRTKMLSFNCVYDRDKSKDWELKAERRTEKRGTHESQKEEQAADQMDRNQEIQNMESIKKTMLTHEDIFKQQVRELHRLYHVQKMLMGEIKKQIEQNRSWSPLTTTTSLTNKNSINRPCQAFPCPGNDLSPRNFDLEGAIKGDISSHGGELGNGCALEEHEVELSLSIGGKMSMMNPKMAADKKFVPTLLFEPDQSGPAPDNSASTETSDPNRKRPHWLFQV